MMDLKFLEEVSRTLGVAGLGIGIFFLLMRIILKRQDIFSRIDQYATYRFLRLVTILSFCVAIAALLVYAFIKFFAEPASAQACGNFRSVIANNVIVNCSGLPIEERRENFGALENDLLNFDNGNFPRLVNTLSREAEAAQANLDVTDREFWTALGEQFSKNASRLNRAYRELAVCFTRAACAYPPARRESFCRSVTTQLRWIDGTSQAFRSLKVGINIQPSNSETMLPDHVVILPDTGNLRSLVSLCA